MLNLALPWNESAPVTVDRMTWLMPMLADYPIEILRFLRDICNMTETTEDFFGLGYNQRADLGDNQAVIIDLGSSKIKCGWAGDPAPTESFASEVDGRPIIDRGVVKDFDGLETILRKCFKLLNTDPTKYLVIIAMAPKTPKTHKDKIAGFLFDKLHIPSLFICSTSYAGLCWTEKMSGLIVTVGSGICHAVPFYSGVLIHHAIQRLDVAGQDIDEFLDSELKALGKNLSKKQVEEYKMNHGYIALDYPKEASLETKIAEVLFSPHIMNKTESVGIAELVKRSINQCELDTRKDLWENVVVVGGGSMFPGFLERLHKELKELCPDNASPSVVGQPNRYTSIHQGCSNMTFWDEFYPMIVSADEWADSAEEIFNEKCLN